MVVTPDIKRYGEAELILQGTLGGTRTVTATAQGGAYPGANVGSGTTTLTVDIAEATAGTGPPAGEWFLAAVEDATDVSGDYTGGTGAGVLSIVDLGTGGALTTPVNLTIGKQGHFRLVLMAGDSDANAQDAGAVNTGGASAEYHFDTDGNDAEGGLNLISVSGNRVDGYDWREADLQSITYSGADNKFYSNTFTLSTDISSATLINPQEVKVGLRITSADGSVVDVLDRLTPTTAGVATGVTRNVDTDYAAASTDYYMMVGVNDVLGDGSTPAGELPDFLASGTITGTTTSQRAWILFDTPAAGYTLANGGDRVYQTAGDLTIGSGITIYEDAGVTPGATSWYDSGYTTAQDLFTRPFPNSTEDAHPYLETYVYDAYGNPLNTVNVRAEIRMQTDATSDDGQNLTTDANGRIRWDYDIVIADPAFNRYVKPGSARQTSSHVSTGPDDPDTPPAEFSVANSDHLSDYPAPYPAYPRRVWVRGNAFSGTKEPEDEADDVFGINSEIVFEAMWTGTLAAISTETVTYVSTVSGVGTGTTVTTGTVTSVGDRFYLASITRRNSAANVDSITGLGLTWSLVESATGTDGRTSVWKGEGTPTGDSTVQVTFSESPTNAVVLVSGFDGVFLTDPIENFEGSNASSDNYSDAIDGDEDGMIVIAVSGDNVTHTAGSGATEQAEVTQGTGSNTATGVLTTNPVTTTGSQAYSGTFSGSQGWAVVAISLRPNVTPLNSDGVPLGAGNREQPLGAGSLKAKLTSELNEGNITVIDPARHNAKDIAGREIDLLSGDEIYLARAEYNQTFNSVSDPGTALNDANTALEAPLTYKSGNLSLDSIAAPTDPASIAYYQGYASTTAQRNTFTLTDDLVDVGFTSDSGMFGYFRIPISFFAIDLSITCAVTPEVTQSDPTVTRRFGIKTIRVTTDGQFVDVTPDEAPIYALYGLANDGTQDLIESGVSTATAAPADFYVDITVPTGYFAVKLIAFGKVNGSRTPGGDGTPIQIGFQFDATDFATGFPFK